MKYITLLVVFMLCFAGVTVDGAKDIDGTKQWVYITLTDGEDTYQYTTVQPWNGDTSEKLSGAELQAYIEKRERRYLYGVKNIQYRGLDISAVKDCTDKLDCIEKWIQAGVVNPDNSTIEKQEWTGKHPVSIMAVKDIPEDTPISELTIEQLKEKLGIDTINTKISDLEKSTEVVK